MILVATEDGVYREDGGLFCCRGLAVYDILEDLVCAESGLYRLPTLQKLDRRACWRLYREDRTYASLEGPVVLEVERGRELDFRGYAAELGWHFPLGAPHVTDFARFGDVLAAAVEVGNLMAGDSVDSLRPLDFAEDQHNLLAFGRRLLVATASGIYVSQDLRSFKQAEGSEGYAHALVLHGGRLFSHLMRTRPVISSDDGEFWREMPHRLPPPTFGTTGLASHGGRLIYSTTETYEIGEGGVEKLFGPHPMTMRVVAGD